MVMLSYLAQIHIKYGFMHISFICLGFAYICKTCNKDFESYILEYRALQNIEDKTKYNPPSPISYL